MKRLVLASLVCFAFFACGRTVSPPGADAALAPSTLAARTLTRISDARQVCMAIDRAFPEPQLAVPVAGRTYYACCEDCRERLERDPALRSAVDPVSSRPVDKAQAVLGRAPDDSVLYFESEASFAAYQAR